VRAGGDAIERNRAEGVSFRCASRVRTEISAAIEPGVGTMEPRKHYDIANVLAVVAVLFFLAAAVILFYSFSQTAAPPSANVPPITAR
jgi:hypothetical protein